MKKHFLFTGLLALTLPMQAQYKISIDPTVKYQTMIDFGASDCWTADYVGKYFDEAVKAQAARWLFSQEFDTNGNPLGIGLSNWRVNVGAGSATQGAGSNIADETRRTECFINKDGSYDWNRSAGQQYFMQKAKAYGVDHFLLFSNSAPIFYTKNGYANANNQSVGCNLSDDHVADFAEFLATTAGHFSSEGYNITYLSPVNEPQYEWKDGQEGSPWSNSDIAKLARELDKSIGKRNLNTRILLPEAGKWEYLTAGSGAAENQTDAFWNPSAATYIGGLNSLAPIVAGHSYWNFQTNNGLTATRQKVAASAAAHGLSVFQTEWSMLDAAPGTETGFPASYEDASYMDIALFMGKLIYCDIVNAHCASWAYWTAFGQEKWGQKNRFYLLRLNAKGDEGTAESYGSIARGGTISDNPNLWVLGNYSRFVRPGYQRIALTGSNLSLNGLMGTAFVSPDGKQIVTVFVNMGYTTRLNMDFGTHAAASARQYVTAEGKNLQYTQLMPEQTIVVPKASVVTCVFEFDTTTGISTPHINTAAGDDIYNLQGTCVGHGAIGGVSLPAGVYIQNGKKIIIP